MSQLVYNEHEISEIIDTLETYQSSCHILHWHALFICQLPRCNLFIQHVSYDLWRDTTSVLWTPVHFLILIKPPTAIIRFLLLSTIITVFHTVHLIHCFQQAGEIDNLFVSLGQSSLVVLCAVSTLVTGVATLPSTAPYVLAPSQSTKNLLKNLHVLLVR